jgi:hypothetical protein
MVRRGHLDVTVIGVAPKRDFKWENATALAMAFMVAGGGFEAPTFGLCLLTHLSMRFGLDFHPIGMLAIRLCAFPHVPGVWFGLPYRSRDVGLTDFDE